MNIRNNYFRIVLLFFLTISGRIFAQPICGTPEATRAELDFLLQNVKTLPVAERNNGTTCVPIQIWAFRQSDGSGGISQDALIRGLAYLNYNYLQAGIEFYYCGDPVYANDSDLYNFDGTAPDNDTESQLVSASGESFEAVNVYVVNSIVTSGGTAAAGYAYLPYSDNPNYNRILMRISSYASSVNGTLSHEFGHYFSLLHTHQGTENGPFSSNAENVPRTGAQANCSTDGDLLCDTEADPRYDSNDFDFGTCSYTGSGTDQFGNLYTPPVDNIMSYYPDACGGIFTSDQYTQIAQGLATRLGHNSYSLDCSPPGVNVPTGLNAQLNNDENGIDLSWTDNASNEIGYLVERSTSSGSTGFRQLTDGYTAANGTSYTDYNIASNTQYWYRVKPANGDCDTYSSVANFTTPTLYCTAGSGTCDEYISRVQIGSIDNSSGCPAGGYSRYTDQSTNVNQGNSYSLTVDNAVYYLGDNYGVFVDWNQDGDFYDSGETMASGPITNTVTTNLLIPPTASLGDTRMRIRITYQVTPDPCGIDTYGEVEDYTLHVQAAPLPVEWLSFQANVRGQEVVLEWATATETDNDRFVVERSADGATFDELGAVPGQGTSLTPTHYDWIDRQPLPGTSYYRLQQVDLDGRSEFSAVVAVEFSFGEEFGLYPNPSSGQLTLRWLASDEGQLELRIYSAGGQLLSRQMAVQTPGFNEWPIDCSQLPEGVYFLQWSGEQEGDRRMFVKQGKP